MKYFLSILFLVLVSQVYSSTPIDPAPATTSSREGTYLVRIIPPDMWGRKTNAPATTELKLFKLTSEETSYSLVSKFRHIGLSDAAYINETGDRVVVINVSGWNITVYDSKGNLMASWKMADFLSPESIKLLEDPHGYGSVDCWSHSASWDRDDKTLSIEGPMHPNTGEFLGWYSLHVYDLILSVHSNVLNSVDKVEPID